MNATLDGNRDGEMTLGFELTAFKELTEPNEVVDDTRRWSRYVGVIGNDTDVVRSYIEDHRLNVDFESGNRDKWLALQEVYDKTNTDRHVFVGRSEDDRRAAERTGWEFIFVEDAAEKAGWTLTEQSTIGSRIRSRLQNLLSVTHE